VKTITSRHNPIVTRYRETATGAAPDLVLLDGAHLIAEAVRAGLPVRSVACSPRGFATAGANALLDELRAAGAEIYSVTHDVMRAMSPVQAPSGIVALASRPVSTLDRVLGQPPQLVVVAVDVQDPGNVGAIVRAAEAGGASGALFTGTSADPFGWKALRGSMGSALRVPVVTADAQEVLAAARARGVRVVATVPRHGRSLFECDLRGPTALLLGGEGPGLPDALVERADETISIPMQVPVESLNVAVAAALLVYEATRQRGWRGPGSK
jgi:TrmH family RNA methyltransferase